MRRRLNPRIVILVVVVGLLVVFAVVGALTVNTRKTSSAVDGTSNAPSGATPAGTVSSGTGVKTREAPDAASGGTEDGIAATVPLTGPSPAHYLVRSGELSLLIKRGTLLTTVDRIGSMTAGMSGYIVSSSIGSSTSDYRSVEPQPLDDQKAQLPQSTLSEAVEPDQAWLTLRIPQRSFETAVKRFAELGEVQRITTSSEDVTSQYVDLQARLRHYRAVERRLLRFLAATRTIRDMLTVQDRIDTVQLSIEQLEAQLKSLRETTTYGTLSISLLEKGVPQTGQIDPTDTFRGVFWNSLTLLGRGAHLTALAVTAALPFVVVLGGLGLAVWYAARRLKRRRHPQEPPLTP